MKDLVDMWEGIDVHEALAAIAVPTLVMHRRDDIALPISAAREMAAAIPNAHFVELDGADHFAHIGDVDQWLDAVETFVTGIDVPAPQRRAQLKATTTEIHTFGGFRVARGGVDVPLALWGSRRSRLLCKRLAAAAGAPVSRDELAELLWPDDPTPSKLSARLSVQLSKVRRVLGGGVVADRDSVRLNLDTVSLDLARFQTAVAARRADEVVAIHRGPFLPEDIYEPWAEGPRERARAGYLGALGVLADHASISLDHQTVIELAQRLLEADPYDSSAHQRLIGALDACGRHGDAQHARDRHTERMHELGVPDN
jgi:DNA-binding SARP family transcriptional activator